MVLSTTLLFLVVQALPEPADAKTTGIFTEKNINAVLSPLDKAFSAEVSRWNFNPCFHRGIIIKLRQQFAACFAADSVRNIAGTRSFVIPMASNRLHL